MTESLLSIKQLKFSYTQEPLLEVDSFELAKERCFVYGPSGFGKSTLLSLISGILDFQSGEIKLCGEDLKSLSNSKKDKLRGEKLGFIFQNFNLFSYLNVTQNILLPYKMHKRGSLEQAKQLIDRLGISKIKDQKANTLSLGQQQRVAAARALMGGPQLIIADEPTSALDSQNTKNFMELLIEAQEEQGFGLILVSHDERLKPYFNRELDIRSMRGTLS
jgi:putative ABC transport system ATP-binding protein